MATRGVGIALITIVALLLVAPASAFARPYRVASASTAVTTVKVEVGDTAGVKGPMTMTVTPTSAPAGKVKFTVTNNGTIIHEMVVLKTNTAYDKLPVNSKTHKVSEAKSVGEVEDVPKGKTKSKTLTLKKGKYVVGCNIAKHYDMGMRAAFTVT
ncbi:MAG: sulfocyanin-like copper-binding protein [Acidimicrobiia bacterium]